MESCWVSSHESVRFRKLGDKRHREKEAEVSRGKACRFCCVRVCLLPRPLLPLSLSVVLGAYGRVLMHPGVPAVGMARHQMSAVTPTSGSFVVGVHDRRIAARAFVRFGYGLLRDAKRCAKREGDQSVCLDRTGKCARMFCLPEKSGGKGGAKKGAGRSRVYCVVHEDEDCVALRGLLRRIACEHVLSSCVSSGFVPRTG